jgi:hypothetical protein
MRFGSAVGKGAAECQAGGLKASSRWWSEAEPPDYVFQAHALRQERENHAFITMVMDETGRAGL